MKVKELMEILSKLDQEKNIHYECLDVDLNPFITPIDNVLTVEQYNNFKNTSFQTCFGNDIDYIIL